jgi:heme exporter protein D
MSWGSVGEFIAMGGYGWYVWGAYDVTFVLLGLELWLVLRRQRAARRQLKERGGNSK